MRFRHILPAVLIAPLAVSACASGSPLQSPDQGVLTPAKRPNFPQFLLEEGKRYDRLTGIGLERAIRGKTFCPSPACSGIDGTVESFEVDGIYLVFGDRWDGGGRYTIVDDIVSVKVGDTVQEYAFYRSEDGTVGRAFVDRAGVVRLARVFTK